MAACTHASHAEAKRVYAPTLVYRAIQPGGDGLDDLVLVDCVSCHSTLAYERADYEANVGPVDDLARAA